MTPFERDQLARWKAPGVSNSECARRLGASLYNYWIGHGHNREGETWLTRAVTADGEQSSLATRAEMYMGLAILREDVKPDRLAGIELTKKALALYREVGDQRGIARALHTLGYLYFGYDWEQSRLWLTAAVQAFEALQVPPHSSLHVLSMLEFCTGNLSAARALSQQRLDLARQEGAEEQRMLANIELAWVCYFEGDVEPAEALAETLIHNYRIHPTEAWLESGARPPD